MAKQKPKKKFPSEPIQEPPTKEKQGPVDDPPADPVDDNSPMEVILPDSNPGLDGFK